MVEPLELRQLRLSDFQDRLSQHELGVVVDRRARVVDAVGTVGAAERATVLGRRRRRRARRAAARRRAADCVAIRTVSLRGRRRRFLSARQHVLDRGRRAAASDAPAGCLGLVSVAARANVDANVEVSRRRAFRAAARR